MGEWVTGALINVAGSITINFGTNLLKLGHNQRDKLYSFIDVERNERLIRKPIFYFQTWRIGVLFFALGNCLNFISFGFASQSLLAALGSIQLVSNIVFAYFMFHKTVSVKVMTATAFIIFGNIFLVSFGNHHSSVYTPEQLIDNYNNTVFLLYCLLLVFIVTVSHFLYRQGKVAVSVSVKDSTTFWRTLQPFSYAVLSGAIGSCSVLFGKSLSNMLRLSIGGKNDVNCWFTYLMIGLLFATGGFWVTRLNEGLSLFDAILIVPMFQIVWTFFSICTGFVYFQEYNVLTTLRIWMFLLGLAFVFIGISLLGPDENKGSEQKTSGGQVLSDASRDVKLLMDGFDANDDGTNYMKSGKAQQQSTTALFKARNTKEDVR